uniref:Uncharacterized protein n=2 Tax=Acrobeloides nanus TaxID=290746 RepID=A0A914EA44_9BILA
MRDKVIMNATIEWSNRTIELVIHSLEAVELMLILASIILNGFFMYIFIKAPLFHENLIRLFKCLYLAFLVMTSARIVVLCAELTGFDTGEQEALTPEILKIPVFGFCELIQFYSTVYVLTIMASVVFERTLATIMLKFYENWIKDWFFVTTACLELSFATLITATFYTGIANILYIGIFLLVCACIGGTRTISIDGKYPSRENYEESYNSTYYIKFIGLSSIYINIFFRK